MRKNEKISSMRKIVIAVLILSVTVVIIGDGDTWTPLMSLATGFLLYGEQKLNGDYRKEQKKTRRADTQASKKVVPFIKLTNRSIHKNGRAVNE